VRGLINQYLKILYFVVTLNQM